MIFEILFIVSFYFYMSVLRKLISINKKMRIKGVLLQKCHSILWTPSKLCARNHIVICNKKLLLMISADNSINITFNFVEKEELEINWLVKEFFYSAILFLNRITNFLNFLCLRLWRCLNSFIRYILKIPRVRRGRSYHNHGSIRNFKSISSRLLHLGRCLTHPWDF